MLSDAVSYAVRREGITKVLDIATLTGAVANMLGNTIAGAMSDDDGFYALFERALEHSGERYLRLPFGREHEKMIKSDVADVKNVGEAAAAPSRQGCLSAASVKEGPGFTWTSPERPGAVLPPMLMRAKELPEPG